jgi:hypothetical protein
MSLQLSVYFLNQHKSAANEKTNLLTQVGDWRLLAIIRLPVAQRLVFTGDGHFNAWQPDRPQREGTLSDLPLAASGLY